LDKEFNIGPHTISIPRLQYASNAPLSLTTNYAVNDIELKKRAKKKGITVVYLRQKKYISVDGFLK
jgi:rRNA-processing protein FCF1